MARTQQRYRPEITQAGLAPTHPVSVVDEFNRARDVEIPGESPLTLYVDEREIVTLMTIGAHPEALALGYLRNQRFVERLEQIESVRVDHHTESVRVTTYDGIEGWDEKLKKRTVTTGCGQGTVFGRIGEQIEKLRLPRRQIHQSMIYGLLAQISDFNQVYQRAGAVHGCALCQCDSEEAAQIHLFVEDVGRHNAADAISGFMWLNNIAGADKWFYTTGRLTSEMVIKVAQMQIPILLSRSGVTHRGLDLARKIGVVLIARAKGRHFLIYNGAEQIVFDAIPAEPAAAARHRAV